MQTNCPNALSLHTKYTLRSAETGDGGLCTARFPSAGAAGEQLGLVERRNVAGAGKAILAATVHEHASGAPGFRLDHQPRFPADRKE
jgi:hypothetical protein